MSHGKSVSAKKAAKDTTCTPGMLQISPQGLFNLTGTPTGLVEYGPTDAPGTSDYSLKRPTGAGQNIKLTSFTKKK